MTVTVCTGGEKCGGCIDCLLSQARQQLEHAEREIDAMQHVHGAAYDFVSNVDNGLIEGSGEMPFKVDASFRELRKALNRDRACEACKVAVDLSNSKVIRGTILCDECARMGKIHSAWLEYTPVCEPLDIVHGFQHEERECVAELLKGIPDDGGSATKKNFEMLVRMAFQGGLCAVKAKGKSNG